MIDSATETAVQAEQANLRRSLDYIRSNERLTPQAKRDDIARAYHRATTKIEDLRANCEATSTGRRATLERQLFGIGNALDPVSASVSLRDAGDRVDAIRAGDSVALARLMGRALQIGDTYLAKAVLQRAWDEGHNDVVNTYLDANSGLESAAQELLNLQRASNPDVFATGFADAAYITPAPRELTGYSPRQIEKMAEGGGDDVGFRYEATVASGTFTPAAV